MKSKIEKAEKNYNNVLRKKSGFVNSFNHNSLSKMFFNHFSNRNKISIILDFLDINEQLPLIKMNSIISKIIISKYNLPFKSVLPLRQYKNNKNRIESKFSKIYRYFKNIIDINNIEKEEYQYIISFLLKNTNNNCIIFDELNDDLNIFFEFLSKIKYIKNISHIKFTLKDCDKIIMQSNLDLTSINFFQNIKHLEIDQIEKSFYFFNKMINYNHNSINNIEKINLNRISIRIKDEISLKYDDYNSLLIPKLTNLKYIFLTKINLSINFLKEIINDNTNLIKLVINNCENNNISAEDEKQNTELINISINNCQNLKHIEFTKNNFSDYFTNEIIKNLITLFFTKENIYMISCGYFRETDLEGIHNHLNNYSNIFGDKEKYLKIKFSPSYVYHLKNNKRTIEISNYTKNNENINQIKYDKIKLILYNTDNPSISNNIKRVMEKYYKKDNSIKYLQIFASFSNGELNQIKNENNEYQSIEKFTLYFQNDEEAITLFGNKTILSILIFFPCVKVISFKNVNFQNDDKKFREYYDDLKKSFELMLLGKKNEILNWIKNKNIKINLEEIKFYNCYYYNKTIDKYLLKEIENGIYPYFKKKVKLTFIE